MASHLTLSPFFQKSGTLPISGNLLFSLPRVSFLPEFCRVHFVWLFTQMPSSQEALLAVALSKIMTFSFLHFPALFYFLAHNLTQHIIYIIYTVYCLSPLAELKLNKGRDLFFFFLFPVSQCLIDQRTGSRWHQREDAEGPRAFPSASAHDRHRTAPPTPSKKARVIIFLFYVLKPQHLKWCCPK